MDYYGQWPEDGMPEDGMPEDNVPPEERHLVAHLSCRAITIRANFCRCCGKALNRHNTFDLAHQNFPKEYLDCLFEKGQYLIYESLQDIIGPDPTLGPLREDLGE
jgi:hypothetical protein